MNRKMVTARVVHSGGFIEQISTDNPELLGQWIIYTVQQLTSDERQLQGNWHIEGWELKT